MYAAMASRAIAQPGVTIRTATVAATSSSISESLLTEVSDSGQPLADLP